MLTSVTALISVSSAVTACTQWLHVMPDTWKLATQAVVERVDWDISVLLRVGCSSVAADRIRGCGRGSIVAVRVAAGTGRTTRFLGPARGLRARCLGEGDPANPPARPVRRRGDARGQNFTVGGPDERHAFDIGRGRDDPPARGRRIAKATA